MKYKTEFTWDHRVVGVDMKSWPEAKQMLSVQERMPERYEQGDNKTVENAGGG